MTASAPARATAFSTHLRDWRRRRRLSQLDLALAAGVSQRHLSFLESGRAQPSRGMVLQLAASLDVPLRERNAWLTGAGFAPGFATSELTEPAMVYVLGAVKLFLRNHEPFPAALVDTAWNIRLANRPFELLAEMLGAETWEAIGGPERNLLRLMFHPEGLRSSIRNWDAIAPLLWQRATREADSAGGGELRLIMEELLPMQDLPALRASESAGLLPVIPLEIEAQGRRLSMFTMLSTFGTPHDVTADELRIESFFPADRATEDLFLAFGRNRERSV